MIMLEFTSLTAYALHDDTHFGYWECSRDAFTTVLTCKLSEVRDTTDLGIDIYYTTPTTTLTIGANTFTIGGAEATTATTEGQ